MTEIIVNQFEGYDLDEFTDFLKATDDSTFEIKVPKKTIIYFSTNEDISWEYAIAAYIGQKLNEISSIFSYTNIRLDKQGSFTFRITTTQIDELADLLSEISSVFGNSNIVEPINFTSEVSAFIKESKKKKIACKNLFETACEYYKY